jgi:hypothetical protein
MTATGAKNTFKAIGQLQGGRLEPVARGAGPVDRRRGRTAPT